jgi:preprotein translocase subunit SecE
MQAITFLKEVREELSKVVWPSQAEVVRLTVVVILVSVIVGLYLGAIDFLLTKFTEVVLTR